MERQPQRLSKESPETTETTTALRGQNPAGNQSSTLGATPQKRMIAASDNRFFLQESTQLSCAGCGHPFRQHTVNRLGHNVCTAWQSKLEKFCECNDYAVARASM